MKKLFLFILVCVLFTGCFLQVEHPSQINVTWRMVDEEIQPASEIEFDEGGIQVNQKTYYGYSAMVERRYVAVEADIDGDTSREFEFEVSSKNPYSKMSNNGLLIEPKEPEKGAITIKSGELEKNVLYEIFPAIGLPIGPVHPYKYMGFDFATETVVEREKRDLWKDRSDVFHFHIGAGAVVVAHPSPIIHNFEDFVAVKDVRDYEYEEMRVYPNEGDVYAVKCEGGGYAIINFVSKGVFVYKYSETGVFD